MDERDSWAAVLSWRVTLTVPGPFSYCFTYTSWSYICDSCCDKMSATATPERKSLFLAYGLRGYGPPRQGRHTGRMAPCCESVRWGSWLPYITARSSEHCSGNQVYTLSHKACLLPVTYFLLFSEGSTISQCTGISGGPCAQTQEPNCSH